MGKIEPFYDANKKELKDLILNTDPNIFETTQYDPIILFTKSMDGKEYTKKSEEITKRMKAANKKIDDGEKELLDMIFGDDSIHDDSSPRVDFWNKARFLVD